MALHKGKSNKSKSDNIIEHERRVKEAEAAFHQEGAESNKPTPLSDDAPEEMPEAEMSDADDVVPDEETPKDHKKGLFGDKNIHIIIALHKKNK